MAGLLGAALAGALAGGGQAMQWNAQSAIEQKRQAALAQLDNDLAMQRQDDQQQFTAQENTADRTFQRGERIAGQEFTAGQNAADRQLRTRLASQQEAGANQRAQLGLLQIGKTSDGDTAFYNPATGSLTETPQGWAPPQDDAAYERRQDSINHLDTQIDELMKVQTSEAWRILPASEQDRISSQLKGLRDQREQLASQTWKIPAARQEPQATAPAAAIHYLQNNDSPAMRSAFREKYGYLPEGF